MEPSLKFKLFAYTVSVYGTTINANAWLNIRAYCACKVIFTLAINMFTLN